MAPTPRQLKRHPSLIPLSQDHHHGLVMAERLIRGRSSNPNVEWPADPPEQAARLVEFFESDLEPHFQAEEAHVFPLAARSMPDGAAEVRALLRDHETMRSMVHAFSESPEARTAERLRAFGELLRDHIRQEERVFFEHLQQSCPEDALESLRTPIADSTTAPACRRTAASSPGGALQIGTRA